MKKYVFDLTDEELKKVWDANEKLRNATFEQMYEDSMEWQLEVSRMFLDNVGDCYRYYDNYSSFFFRLVDDKGYKFLSNMDYGNLHDYSIVDDKTIEECKKYLKLYEEFDYSLAEDDTIVDGYLEKIDELAKQVLAGIEKYLHEFEDVDYSNAFENWAEEIDASCDLYIIDDTYKAYADFTRCYA